MKNLKEFLNKRVSFRFAAYCYLAALVIGIALRYLFPLNQMKRKYERSISKHDKDLEKVVSILKELDIRHRFHWSRLVCHSYGVAKPEKNLIEVFPYVVSDVAFVTGKNGRQYYRFTRRRQTKQEFLSTVFHEIGHILCTRQGIYLEYNKGLKPKNNKIKQKDYDAWASQFLKAERLCDKMGAKMLKEHFPKVPYKSGYSGRGGYSMVQNNIKYVAKAYNLKEWGKK